MKNVEEVFEDIKCTLQTRMLTQVTKGSSYAQVPVQTISKSSIGSIEGLITSPTCPRH